MRRDECLSVYQALRKPKDMAGKRSAQSSGTPIRLLLLEDHRAAIDR